MPRYRVDVADAHAHLFRVTLTLQRPGPQQRLSLPVWVPGSYMVRDLARHLSALQGRQRGAPVLLEQADKTTWVAHCTGRAALTLQYEVYAFDPSVRGAWLDDARGFFNASSLCLRAEGREAEPHVLKLGRLPAGWKVATAMAAGRASGEFCAADYDELIDHPFELGRPWKGGFRAAGVQFRVVVSGAWPSFDGERLLADTRRVCAAAIALWHGRAKPAFDDYLFLLNAGDGSHGQGGLEHRASAALSCARRELPRRGETEPTDDYTSLLGLICHEFLHAWNVKRLRPVEFASVDLQREQPTHLLWFFEGFTSYYDEWLLLRAGLVDAAHYLRLLARSINALQTTPGRRLQSVAQASFDAWTKYYRRDENTPNATVSYYTKGALVALAFDLTLRQAGQGCLDDVMQRLWQRCAARGVTETDIEQALADTAGRSMLAELQSWVHGTGELPLQPLLETAGVSWQSQAPTFAQSLGLRLSEGAVGGVHVKSVLRGGVAEAAGLSAGDELLAVDGWRIRRLDDARHWLAPGGGFDLLLVRDQRVLTRRVQPVGDGPPKVSLALNGPANVVRRGWLGA
jgi:predicted metalloprotease with PDZ domain